MKNKLNIISSLFLVAFFPLQSLANVRIHEIAWMGNDKSQYGEWVELYNNGVNLVDLKDVALYEVGGKTLIIKLSKTIAAGGYYLIARSTPSMPDPVNGLADDLGLFGGSGLSNSGEYLVLKSASGDILDYIDASTGWPAGNAITKETMQLSEGKWVTATGTPRGPNASAIGVVNTVAASSTDTVTSTSASGGGTSNSLDNNSSALSSHSSPVSVSTAQEEIKISVSAGRDRLAMVDTPIVFEEKLFTDKSTNIDGGNVSWSFGDGLSATGNKIVHAYGFPGDYVVVMNVLTGADNYVSRTNVRILPVYVEIVDATTTTVKIKNSSTYETNLGSWIISDGNSDFKFPNDTILLPKKELVLSSEITGVSLKSGVIYLMSPSKKTYSIFKIKKNIVDISHNATMVEATSTDIAKTDSSIASILLSSEQKLLEARENLLKTVIVSEKGSVAEDMGVLVQNTEVKDTMGINQKNPEVVQVIEKPKLFLRSVLEIPVKSFRFLRGLFF